MEKKDVLKYHKKSDAYSVSRRSGKSIVPSTFFYLRVVFSQRIYDFARSFSISRLAGASKMQAIYSAIIKYPTHFLLFNDIGKLGKKIEKKERVQYNHGIWYSLHFGLNHFRPLFISQRCLYLRANKIRGLKKNNYIEFHYLGNTRKNDPLELLDKIKNCSLCFLTLDGKYQNNDFFLKINNLSFPINKRLLDMGRLLKKNRYFELIYFDNFLTIRRETIKLSDKNCISEIENLFNSIVKKYPHNFRFSRLKHWD